MRAAYRNIRIRQKLSKLFNDTAYRPSLKSKFRVVKNNTVWYSDECKKARKECRKALDLVKRQPTCSNLEHYGIIRAKTRLIMKSTKRQSWQSFVSKINNRTPLKKVWSMIRKTSGKHSAQKINHLHVNGAEVTDVSDIVNTLGETFSDNSSSDHCSTSFKSYKQNAEKSIQFPLLPITLKTTISDLHSTVIQMLFFFLLMRQ